MAEGRSPFVAVNGCVGRCSRSQGQSSASTAPACRRVPAPPMRLRRLDHSFPKAPCPPPSPLPNPKHLPPSSLQPTRHQRHNGWNPPKHTTSPHPKPSPYPSSSLLAAQP